MTFMTGTAIGMMAGYIAGSKREVYVDSQILEMMSEKKDVLHKAIEKDLDELKKDYRNRLKELSKAINK
jgi:hypothetical protein